MGAEPILTLLAALPKAELHLHLEGSIAPETAVELAARHGTPLTRDDVLQRYAYADFKGFLEAFKWVTTLLHAPEDYALVAERLAQQLAAQNVVYAEVTLSVGVMLRRKQDPMANFVAIRGAVACAKGLRVAWVFDAVRQFGPAAAMEVARLAAQVKSEGVVAFGLGGDELALPAAAFLKAYEYAAAQGLHRLVHAGEIGGPESVRDAIEILGAERIGHGLAAMRDASTVDLLADRQVPLELCPSSNLRTGALARQLGRPDAQLADYPLRSLFRRGLRMTLSTDDPAMFGTTLIDEYGLAYKLGFAPFELARLAEMSFDCAFLSLREKHAMLAAFETQVRSLGLL